MRSFQEFVKEIDVEYWETKYDGMVMKRKIPIQTIQKNLSMVFNRQELESLTNLIMQATKKPFNNLSVLDIDYIFFLN
ncbi:MAG: hypothetical protein JKY22_05525 [Flavobacteriaceae bacterium]|nr:hypothetical protein [Flavobacteriaceae bacterium]